MIDVKDIDIGIDMSIVQKALNDLNTPERILIAKIGVHVVATLLNKNKDYGSSVFKAPSLCPNITSDQAIRVRISDKIARIQQLSTGEPNLVNESLQDTFLDLAGYSILKLVDYILPEVLSKPPYAPREIIEE